VRIDCGEEGSVIIRHEAVVVELETEQLEDQGVGA
jgi:hypothetical protein